MIRQPRVLVVDNEAEVRSLICRVLEERGFATLQAPEGGVALGLVAERRPALVVLDLEMPGLDGWGFLKYLEGSPYRPPVVFLSGDLGFDGFARGARAGVAAFVSKPIHFGRLVTTCRRVLEASASAAEGPDERRSGSRRPLLVKVGLLSKLGRPNVAGELADLSTRGARIILVGPLEVGSHVRFAIDSAVAGDMMRFDAVVRWCAPLPDGYAHGLAFVKPDPELRAALHRVLGEPAGPGEPEPG